MNRWYVWLLGLVGAVTFLSPVAAEEMQKPMFGQGATYEDIIRSDHQQISSLLTQLNQEADVGRRKELWAQLKDGLGKHMKAEEEFLYPRLEKKPESKGLAMRAKDEHMAAKAQLAKIDPGADQMVFTERLQVLTTLINAHVGFEESELLDVSRRTIEDEPKLTEQFKSVYR